MSAAPVTTASDLKLSMAERAEKFLAESNRKYQLAVGEARLSATQTATERWQINYASVMQTHRRMTEQSAQSIVQEATYLLTHDSSEDTEKSIKDALKAITAEREAHNAWHTRQVRPLVRTVEVCDAIRDEVLSNAKRAEREMELTDRGLYEAVEKIVAAWPVPKWNDETGVVTIE